MAANAEPFRKYGAKFPHPRRGRWLKSRRIEPLRATWCSSSRTTRPRSPATTRPNTRRRSSCAGASVGGDIVIIEGYDGGAAVRQLTIFALRRYTGSGEKSGERGDVRHAADRGGCRRAHGAHAGEGDLNETPGLMLAGATEGRGLAVVGAGTRRACRPAARTACPVTSEVASADACGRRDRRGGLHRSGRDREAFAALAAETHIAHIIGTTGTSAAG